MRWRDSPSSAFAAGHGAATCLLWSVQRVWERGALVAPRLDRARAAAASAHIAIHEGAKRS
jgi:hypothetical protein